MVRRLGPIAGVVAAGISASAMAMQEPQINEHSKVHVVACLEMETDYRVRVGFGSDGTLVAGRDLVLVGVQPVAGSTSTVTGDFAGNGPLEAQMVSRAGMAVEVDGYVEDLTEQEKASGEKFLRKIFVSGWQDAGPCPVR
jgi:hypothetical protein